MGRRKDSSGFESISRFGCLNGREHELVEEMKKYRLAVLDVSETKVRGNGVKMIGDTMCVYSRVQGGRAKAGVAILLSESFGRYLKEWRCVDEQIVWIRLKVEGIWVSVVQVYAPTEDSCVSNKYEFFSRLQETVGRVTHSDLLIVMVDMNARVGNDTGLWGEVLGNHGE